jgi:hypothetical protein
VPERLVRLCSSIVYGEPLVVMILTMLIVLGIIWGAGKIPDQARVLMRVMDAQLDVLQQRLLSVVVDLFGPDGNRDFFRWFP